MSEFGRLTALTALMLPGNEIVGTIPTDLGKLVALRHLWLSNNIDLSGSLPVSVFRGVIVATLNTPLQSELGLMTSLTAMWLAEMKLTGTLPSSLGALSALEGLSLQRNEINGTIPPIISKLTSLQIIELVRIALKTIFR
jgi:Leucine-rich repeat (LRR) protein